MFLNGIQCYSTPVTARALTIAWDQLHVVAGGASTAAKQLLQCYALDGQSRILSLAQHNDVRPPQARGGDAPDAAASVGGGTHRLLATALHDSQDVHHWEFTPARLPGGAAVDQPWVLFRILFAVDELRPDRRRARPPSVPPSSTVTTPRWPRSSGAQPTRSDRRRCGPPMSPAALGVSVRRRVPAPPAFGERRAVAVVTMRCAESAFLLSGCEPDTVVALDVTAAGSLTGPLRYAVYGAAWTPTVATLCELPRLLGDREEGMLEDDGRRSAAPPGKRLAVLVGVSKYTRRPRRRMCDLEYADDAPAPLVATRSGAGR